MNEDEFDGLMKFLCALLGLMLGGVGAFSLAWLFCRRVLGMPF